MNKLNGLFLSLLWSLYIVASAAAAPPLSGAIFTTTFDGSIVNENVHYEAKEDVYLDGGPGLHAPANAAGLPEGDYYFQVTDPSGQDLLSSDHISCRKIHVNEHGVIDFVYGGTNYNWSNKDKMWESFWFKHEEGIDMDHSELGAITVQLFPYDDTPNPGGVYKVWITPVADYDYAHAYGDNVFDDTTDKNAPVNGENYQPGNYHGFIPSKSKTDNYKVEKKGKPFEPPVIKVLKFHDANLNGIQDPGEEFITGWPVDVTDPLGVTNGELTPGLIVAEPSGLWSFVEATPAGTLQTVSYLDGSKLSLFPLADPLVEVNVLGESGETHEVVYGNVGLGRIEVCKVYDRNGNGSADEGEPPVPGWKMTLAGEDVTGNPVQRVQYTDETGCTTFESLLPGTYTVTEEMPAFGGWEATGPTSFEVVIESFLNEEPPLLTGTFTKISFTNICLGVADFGTKGYWHNKNGLAELTDDDIFYVNGLLPYSAPSSYFDDGDEPFDGFFTDGTPVSAAYNDAEEIWAGGTARAEISQFLIDANAGGDPREQLAQQLLAFIFNARNRLGGVGAYIYDGGVLVSTSDLIDEAINAWEFGDGATQEEIKTRLDAFNNSDAIEFIHYDPCEVAY